MVENILYQFYFFEKKQELHFIARLREPQAKMELPVIKVWVWNYNQGRSWMNTIKSELDYKYPNHKEHLKGEEIRRYLSPIKTDFFDMLFSGSYQ